MTKPFKGVINIDVRDSVPDWEPYEQPKAPDGSPNVIFIVWDDTGFGAMGAVRRPDRDAQHEAARRQRPALHPVPHDGDLFADPRGAADRPQPHDGRHVLHRRGDRGLPGHERAHPVRDRDSSARCSASAATTRTCSASGTACPRTRPTWPRPSATGRPGRGFERYYGYLGGETNQYYPDLVQDQQFVEQPSDPVPSRSGSMARTAISSPRTWSTRPSA